MLREQSHRLHGQVSEESAAAASQIGCVFSRLKAEPSTPEVEAERVAVGRLCPA